MKGKREAGEVPARSRHCDCGAVYDDVTERSGRLYGVMMHKSGNLPFCWYMTGRSGSRGIDRTVFQALSGESVCNVLCLRRGFLVMRSCLSMKGRSS